MRPDHTPPHEVDGNGRCQRHRQRSMDILHLSQLFSLGGLKYRQNREAGANPAQSRALL